jgi:hypothetical protein
MNYLGIIILYKLENFMVADIIGQAYLMEEHSEILELDMKRFSY